MRITNWSNSIAIIGLLMTASSAFADDSNEEFEAPVCIKAGDEVMNSDGAMLYPSPAIFDVDNDGLDELVIGTIFGDLYFCENTNSSTSGDPAWAEPKQLQSTDGEPIKLNNW